jgi:hypothetical protein
MSKDRYLAVQVRVSDELLGCPVQNHMWMFFLTKGPVVRRIADDWFIAKPKRKNEAFEGLTAFAIDCGQQPLRYVGPIPHDKQLSLIRFSGMFRHVAQNVFVRIDGFHFTQDDNVPPSKFGPLDYFCSFWKWASW